MRIKLRFGNLPVCNNVSISQSSSMVPKPPGKTISALAICANQSLRMKKYLKLKLNRGAYEAGGKSIGLSIELPDEQFANPYISPELSFNFKYFFMRKLWFAQIAKALIVFPGGFGTMDELWEMLTLLQTGKLPKRNLILIYGRRYWDEVLNWKAMVRWGTIDESEYNLLQFADTVDEAFDRVRAGLEKYHMNVDSFLQAYRSTPSYNCFRASATFSP